MNPIYPLGRMPAAADLVWTPAIDADPRRFIDVCLRGAALDLDRQKLELEQRKLEYEKVKVLFEYTKFHIGAYLTLGAILLALLGLGPKPITDVNLEIARGWIGAALALMALAGFAGGVIAASLPERSSVTEFLDLPTGPRGCQWLAGKWWTVIEHWAFWISLFFATIGIVAPKVWDPWLRFLALVQSHV